MCPVCIATVALIAAGTGSTGSISALVVGKLRGKSNVNKEQGERDGKKHRNPSEDENATDRVA